MEQLILHLFGDFVSQTDWMAANKTKKLWVAFVHAVVYSLPFLLLTRSWVALSVICISHALIDHFRIAKHIIFLKNITTSPALTWDECKEFGYPMSVPQWMQGLLLLFTDLTIHLAINYACIRWL